MGLYTQNRDLYSSKTVSEITSEVYFIGDADKVSLEVRGSPSTTSIQASNSGGLFEAIPENAWSTMTTVIGTGVDMLDIESGPRWLRTLRSETTEVLLALRTVF